MLLDPFEKFIRSMHKVLVMALFAERNEVTLLAQYETGLEWSLWLHNEYYATYAGTLFLTCSIQPAISSSPTKELHGLVYILRFLF